MSQFFPPEQLFLMDWKMFINKKGPKMGSLEKFWKKWITGEVGGYYGIESSPVIHFSIVYVAPSPAIHFTTGLFTKKNFSAHKSKVVRDKKLGDMSPQANHFISKNSRIFQNNPGEKFCVKSFCLCVDESMYIKISLIFSKNAEQNWKKIECFKTYWSIFWRICCFFRIFKLYGKQLQK